MKLLFALLFIGITCTCCENTSKCNPNSIVIIDGGVDSDNWLGKTYIYDLEFKNFDRSCVSDESIKELAIALTKNKKLKFPIGMVRCFEYNGGGIYNDIANPSGCDELRFLIINDIDSLGNFLDYEIVNIE
jgi:hypothetical protein